LKTNKKRQYWDGGKEEGVSKRRPVQCVGGLTEGLQRNSCRSWG